jgi:hypothetical protein
MRIAIRHMNHHPEQTGIGWFTTGRGEHLTAEGHAVTVMTALRHYPEWKIQSGYEAGAGAKARSQSANGCLTFRGTVNVAIGPPKF